jgi:DNA-binding transcriptional regulator YiaG
MGRSAAQASTTTKSQTIHQYVGKKIKELRGTMLPSDFAAKNGTHQAVLSQWEAGAPASRKGLEFLANRNGISVGYFFPNGEVPADYPER